MPELISFSEASKALADKLWPNGALESSPAFGHENAVARRRLWESLIQRPTPAFRAYEMDGQTPIKTFDETARIATFAKCQQPHLLKENFDAWLANVVALCQQPSESYISAYVAISYVAWGEYLTADDIAWAFESQQTSKTPSTGQDLVLDERNAAQVLLDACANGKLALFGRQAPAFSEPPTGEHEPIPRSFFVDPSTIAFIAPDTAYRRDNQNREAWSDLRVSTGEFKKAFHEQIVPQKRRAPREQDHLDALAYVKAFNEKHGKKIDRPTFNSWAYSRNLSRKSLDEIWNKLPDVLRRAPGETDKSLNAKDKLQGKREAVG